MTQDTVPSRTRRWPHGLYSTRKKRSAEACLDRHGSAEVRLTGLSGGKGTDGVDRRAITPHCALFGVHNLDRPPFLKRINGS